MISGAVAPRGRYLSSLKNYDFRVNAFEFSVIQTPENVLCSVAAPAEVSSIPSAEVLFPVREQIWITGGSRPASRDRVAHEVEIDMALLRALDQVLMCDQ